MSVLEKLQSRGVAVEQPGAVTIGRPFTSDDDARMLKEVREIAEETRYLVNMVQQFVEDRSREPLPEGHAPHSQVTHPGRWAALAQTELQSGFMKLVRAIEQPGTF